MQLFKELSESEVQEFKEWARMNYEPMNEINEAYHPVVQYECTLMCKEYLEKRYNIEILPLTPIQILESEIADLKAEVDNLKFYIETQEEIQ